MNGRKPRKENLFRVKDDLKITEDQTVELDDRLDDLFELELFPEDLYEKLLANEEYKKKTKDANFGEY